MSTGVGFLRLEYVGQKPLARVRTRINPQPRQAGPDIFWLRELRKASDNLPAPDVLAQETFKRGIGRQLLSIDNFRHEEWIEARTRS